MPSTSPAAPPTLGTRRPHRPLLACTAVMAVLVVVTLCAMVVDDRRLLGESIWLKPCKFGLAFVLYTATLAWLLSFPHRGSRVTWWMGTAFAVTGIVDVGFIVVQAARGTFSHFNNQTDAVNAIGQTVFMSGVLGLFGANLVIAVMLSWQRVTDRPTSRAISAGLGIAVLGMAMAYLVGGTGPQRVTDAYGRPVELGAGHTVMPGDPPVRDGVGAGVPVLRWSTEGGDLRIPHFLGMHGIQVLILAAVLLARYAPRVPWLRTERTRAHLVGVLALSYTGGMVVLLWQALRGQPVTRPDTATLAAFAVLTAATGAALALVRARARRPRPVLPEIEAAPTVPLPVGRLSAAVRRPGPRPPAGR
ncbi:hypothetical protein NMK54_00605 [Nocardia otitidiscaviarum]|uniref:hypothetical protein n=1 Tax=Nocardia otitidiscaviarum TaxID=1823 RepID=UPI00163DAA01|nr:hypothetical protein [Nocardia otitidiscaviarum]MCP9618661.1 hypothetical protein [Nocardia otitidiscaviarum]